MKKLLILVLFTPVFANAHCPVEVENHHETYCASVEWIMGEKKIRNEFVTTEVETPYRIPMREVPQKWIYSKALISLWQKGDQSHTPINLEGFKIFPFMFMENGHGHSADHQFLYNGEEGVYEISKLALQSMRGCWTLRGSFSEDINLEDSFSMGKITPYKNLTDEENAAAAEFCEGVDEGGDSGGGYGGHLEHR